MFGINTSPANIMTLPVLLVCALLCGTKATSVSNSAFEKVTTDDVLQVLTSLQNYRSAIDCAHSCHVTTEACEGFGYSQHAHVCELYAGPITEDISGGVEVYRLRPVEEPPTQISLVSTEEPPIQTSLVDISTEEPPIQLSFIDISVDSYVFSYYLSNDTKTHSEAKEFCAAAGHHLLHMDSSFEQLAVLNLLAILGPHDHARAWVGANDLDVEGKWVCDRHGAALDTENSGWEWKGGEPNGSNDENCAAFRYSSILLVDADCNSLQPYICEKGL